MAVKSDLQEWVFDAVEQLGGEASVAEVAKVIWEKHEADLRGSGDLFYTWQYDMRWAAEWLRKQNRLTLSGRKWALA
ncbi:hypothetical protein HCZ97_13870 [Pseudooceanicola sp. HF7]|nr:hypothetical protein [Pseudooceanicola sp. HF7]NIZ10509.1 hypothetical protein [Pseudooceanicola sp. HF7]